MDHRGLEWFTQNKPLNRRQARWALELDWFDFKIIYQPGTQNTKSDALSRRAEHRPEKGGYDYPLFKHVLKPGQWVPENYEEVIVASDQFVGLRPRVKMSQWLEEKIDRKSVV